MTVMKGSQAIMEILRREGVEYVFGIPGATEVLFMDALEDCPDIKYILGLHEVIAMGMAEGYSRISGKVGVVNLHTCAGVAAAMPLLFNAFLGEVPLVVTAGQQDSRLFMQEPALSGDLVGMAKRFSKWSTEVIYAEDIPLAMRRAFKIAAQPPAGPVFVSLPQNIMSNDLNFAYTSSVRSFTHVRPDSDAVKKAAELIGKAQKPTIILETGVVTHQAVPEAVKLAELIGARVYQPWMADVNFPTAHPLHMGDFDLFNPSIKEIIRSTDVLIVIAAQLFRPTVYSRESLLSDKTKIVQIDNNSWEMAKNYAVDAGILGHIKMSLAELNGALEKGMSPQAREAAEARAAEIAAEKEATTAALREKAEREKDQVPVSVPWLMQQLKDSLKPDTIVMDDCWSCSPTLRRTLDATEPTSYQRTRRGGSIGWGMSGALGAKLAAPDRPVVLLTGDGSAMWANQSLWTAAHYNIGVTYVICANASYTQVKLMKNMLLGEKAKGRTLGMELDEPRIDFCKMAQAMGVPGRKVERPEQLREAFDSAFESGKPNLIEVYLGK
ncbi:thiamine pyrophosphate-binding protein [Chloroflexota bacterium]